MITFVDTVNIRFPKSERRIMGILKFEDFFHPQKDEEYTIITFFDNMIRRDFLDILRRMANGQGCMLCDSVGYNLPEEYDEDDEVKDCIEIWEVCGNNEHSYDLSYEQFIEFLEISGKIWLNNNMIRHHFRAINKFDQETIDMFLNSIKKRYLK